MVDHVMGAAFAHPFLYAEISPKVEYSMTEYCKTLGPVIHALQVWDSHHLEKSSDQA